MESFLGDVVTLAGNGYRGVIDSGIDLQTVLATATLVFCLCALVLCLFAGRAAAAAKAADANAARRLLQINDKIAEMRQLTAQMERSAFKAANPPSIDENTPDLPERPEEAEVEVLHGGETPRYDEVEDSNKRALEAAKTAATVPVWKSFLRRKSGEEDVAH
ncbi:MAG: hypothetical protein AAGC95_15635 [Pseudomonadota bacterium]